METGKGGKKADEAVRGEYIGWSKRQMQESDQQ